MNRPALLLAAFALALAPASFADDRPGPPLQQISPAAGAPPLSSEDAEIVKQLALLEQVELLRNLELFEDKAQDAEDEEEEQPAAKAHQ